MKRPWRASIGIFLVSILGVAFSDRVAWGIYNFGPGYANPYPTLNYDFTASNVMDPSIHFLKGTGAGTTGGTYFDSTGVMRTFTTQNLLLRSEELDNATWVKNNTTVTANQAVGPDRTTNMDLITASGSGYHDVLQSVAGFVAGTTYTLSVFVKPGTTNYAWIADGAESGWHATFFNVSTCTALGATANPSFGNVYVSSGATSYNGVCRIWMSWTRLSTGSANIIIGPGQSGNVGNYTTSATAETIYAWGAQVEVGTAPSTYAYTQTSTSYMPRYDYDPLNCTAGVCAFKGVLFESGSMNRITNSTAFSGWTLSQGTVTDNSTSSLDGTNTSAAFLATATNATDTSITSNTWTVTAGANAACSIFAKPNGSNWIKLETADSTFTNGSTAYFNVSTGTVGTVANYGSGANKNAEIHTMPNGWYRVTLGSTPSATTTTFNCRFSVANGDNTTGSTSGNGLYIWGAQGEAMIYATTYIPTSGSAVTRNQEWTDVFDGSWYTIPQGTFYYESIAYTTRNWGGGIIYVAGTAGYLRQAEEGGFGIVNFRRWIPHNGTTQAYNIVPFYPAADTLYKETYSYQANDLIGIYNGTIGDRSTAATNNPFMTGYTDFSLGHSSGTGYAGWIRKVRFYPTRINNAQLLKMTQ